MCDDRRAKEKHRAMATTSSFSSSPPPPPLELLAGAAVLLFIAWSVGTQSKTVGALAQLGGLQDRWLAQRARAQPQPTPATAAAAAAGAAAAAARRLWDRACFTLGVVNVAATMYLLGAAPTLFYLLHTPKAVLLIGARWLAFVSERPPRHLLLLDFCYCVNALGLLYVWAWPRDARLFQIFFVCANGPVAWSVLAFNQALVFHSWQHITSVFVHVSPMLLSYCLRWHAAAAFAVCDDFPRCPAPVPAALVWAAFSRFYAYWLVIYYVFVFVVFGRYIHERGFQTLFDRVSAHGPLAPLLQRLTREGESELHLIKKARRGCHCRPAARPRAHESHALLTPSPARPARSLVAGGLYRRARPRGRRDHVARGLAAVDVAGRARGLHRRNVRCKRVERVLLLLRRPQSPRPNTRASSSSSRRRRCRGHHRRYHGRCGYRERRGRRGCNTCSRKKQRRGAAH